MHPYKHMFSLSGLILGKIQPNLLWIGCPICKNKVGSNFWPEIYIEQPETVKKLE